MFTKDFFLGEMFLSRSARLCFLLSKLVIYMLTSTYRRLKTNLGIMKNWFLYRNIILFEILIFGLFTKEKTMNDIYS